MSGPDVDALIDRWIGGDAEAGTELYRRYHHRAFKFAMKLTRQEVEAEEVAQAAMVEGLEGIRSGRRPDRFTGWILGVVRHVALEQQRQVRRELPSGAVGTSGGATERSPRTALMQSEMKTLLRRIVDDLPPDLQEVVRLRFDGNFKRKDLAGELGLTPEGVDKRLERAFAKIRAALSRHFTTVVLPQVAAPPGAEALRPSFREVYLLSRVEGLSPGDIARRLDLPSATVEERLAHAVRQVEGARPSKMV